MFKHWVNKLGYIGTFKMECEYKARKLFSFKVDAIQEEVLQVHSE